MPDRSLLRRIDDALQTAIPEDSLVALVREMKAHGATQAEIYQLFESQLQKMGLDSVELVMSVEEHFAIEIPDHIAHTLLTVGSLHSFVVCQLERTGRARDADLVCAELRELICDQLGIRPERVVPEARFVQTCMSIELQSCMLNSVGGTQLIQQARR